MQGHFVATAREMGWADLRNGALLAAAATKFDAMTTVDRSIRHQQNLMNLPLAVVVMRVRSNKFDSLLPCIPAIRAALEVLKPGTLVEIHSP